jgi:hypothetical protein
MGRDGMQCMVMGKLSLHTHLALAGLEVRHVVDLTTSKSVSSMQVGGVDKQPRVGVRRWAADYQKNHPKKRAIGTVAPSGCGRFRNARPIRWMPAPRPPRTAVL